MRIDVVSIFPDYLAPLRLSLVGKAVESGTLDLRVHDLRAHTHDRHRTVDDTPYGGGPGMVMKPEPWGEALDALLGRTRRHPAPGRPDAERPAVHPGGRRRVRRRRTGSSSPAAATRASTRASSSTTPTGCGSTR